MTQDNGMTADRYNYGKVPYSYLTDLPKALGSLCRVFEFGAAKYARDNWKKGLYPQELLDSALRHIMAHRTEALDEESKLPHLAHAVWNLLVLLEQDRTINSYALKEPKKVIQRENPFVVAQPQTPQPSMREIL